MAHRYVLACVVFIFCRVDGESLYGLKGLSVSLKPDIPGEPTDILWKYNGNKLVEFNGKEEHVYGKFKNRITLDWHTAEIEITDLRFEDSGNYQLEVTINNMFHPSSKTLVVIDTVPEPTISCKMNDGSKSGTLECSAESKDSQTQSLMKLEWESHGNVQPGPQLTISLGNEHDDHVYTCNVSNPKSSNITTFTAKDCYPGKSSSVALAAGLVILFLIIFVVLSIVFCHKTRKACFAVRGDDEEKQSPPAENVSDNHETTSQVDESQPLLHTPGANQTSDVTGSDRKMNKGKAPPVRPRSALSPESLKKEGPADEPADLQEDKMSAPEKPGSDQTTAQDEENSPPTDEAAASPPPDMTTGSDRKMNKGKAPPVRPRSALSRESAKKEGPADEPADLQEDKMSLQESSTAPERPGLETTLSESESDQTTVQDEENSPPTDEAAASPPPDMTTGSDRKMNKGKAPPVRPRSALSRESAKKEGPADEPADLQEDKMSAPEKPESDQTTAQDEENSPPTDEAAASPPPDMTTGSDRKMNKGKAPPVRPRRALSRESAKKEGPADEPADLQEDKISLQESSTAPEKPGSDQTTAQDEENSPPTDEAAASPPPDMTTSSDRKMNKGKAPPVLPRCALSPESAKKEGPADEPADLQEDKMSLQESSTAPEKPESDQTTAQDDENTDDATTDQQPDRKKGYVNSVKRKFQ